MGGTNLKAGAKPMYGASRDAVLRAAIELVADDGLASVTYRSLAARAGVSHGAVQYHFANIDDVVSAALEVALDESVADFTTAKSVDEIFEPLERAIERDIGLQTFQADVILEARRYPHLQERIARHQATYRSYLESALAGAGVPYDDELLELLMAVADGILYQRVSFGDADNGRRMRGQLRALRSLLADRAARVHG